MAAQEEKRFTFRVPLKLYKKIKRAAEKEHRPLNQWLIVHLKDLLKQPVRYGS
jgi:predicted HicB family RNase H-like nuclease